MFENQNLILAAGMQRSASTWLFNAARLLMLSSPAFSGEVSYGWIGDIERISPQKNMLIKIHTYDPKLAECANLILYSYRDIRDVIASSKRKFGTKPTLQYATSLVQQHDLWVKKADYVMKYEKFLEDKRGHLQKLSTVLGLHNMNHEAIISELECINYESHGEKNQLYNLNNLMHQNHITNGQYGSWYGELDDRLVTEIETAHREWFDQYGYTI